MLSPSTAPLAPNRITRGRLSPPPLERFPPTTSTVSLGTTGKNASTQATERTSGYDHHAFETQSSIWLKSSQEGTLHPLRAAKMPRGLPPARGRPCPRPDDL